MPPSRNPRNFPNNNDMIAQLNLKKLNLYYHDASTSSIYSFHNSVIIWDYAAWLALPGPTFYVPIPFVRDVHSILVSKESHDSLTLALS